MQLFQILQLKLNKPMEISYVLIDCMPSLGMLTINALAAADSVIIPTQPPFLSAKGLNYYYALYQRLGDKSIPG